MKVFRIEREEHLADTLTGKGAALSDGNRWNSPNTYIVYTADSRALATLEVSVHLDLSVDLPTDRYWVEIDILEEIEIFELIPEDLPDNWDSKPPNSQTQFIGDEFVFDSVAAVLKVPSAIIPNEFNYLINPNHPKAKNIKVVSTMPLSFDFRMKQTGKK